MLAKGDKLPMIQGVDQNGITIKLENYFGKKLVIFFFPKADTPGCTAEACSLNDNRDALAKKNYEIIGVSADSIEKQKKFSDKFKFNYPLIADVDKTFINAFGVWGNKKFMGKEYEGILRTTFLVNELGIIEEVITNVKTKEHAEQILEI